MPLSPEQSAKALESVRPQIEANKKKERDELDEDQRELKMLARRKREAYVEVHLDPSRPDDRLRIRSGLTASEVEEVGGLLAQAEKLTMDGKDDEADQLIFRVIEICTPNEEITAKWLMENRDEYPINDVKTAVQHVYREYLATLVRIQQARRFRSEADGQGTGQDAPMVGHK